jgi:acyl-CoA dehydrogenase
MDFAIPVELTELQQRTRRFIRETVIPVVDRCVQTLGGQGVTDETVVARIFRDMRGFRIYDGPSEVHRWSLARGLAKRAAAL